MGVGLRRRWKHRSCPGCSLMLAVRDQGRRNGELGVWGLPATTRGAGDHRGSFFSPPAPGASCAVHPRQRKLCRAVSRDNPRTNCCVRDVTVGMEILGGTIRPHHQPTQPAPIPNPAPKAARPGGMMERPLCNGRFPNDRIEAHASDCTGVPIYRWHFSTLPRPSHHHGHHRRSSKS